MGLKQALKSVDLEIKQLMQKKNRLQQELEDAEAKIEKLTAIHGVMAVLDGKPKKKGSPANHSSEPIIGITDSITEILEKYGPCTAAQITERMQKKTSVPLSVLKGRIFTNLCAMSKNGRCTQKKFRTPGRFAEYSIK